MVLTMTQYGGTETQDPTQPNQLINPLLNFNGSLQTTTAILIETMATGDVREQIGVPAGGGTTRLIVNDGRTNPELLGITGPFLYIEGRSSSADEASRVVVDAQEVMRQKLSELQRSLQRSAEDLPESGRRRAADGATGRLWPCGQAGRAGLPVRLRLLGGVRVLRTPDPRSAACPDGRWRNGPRLTWFERGRGAG